MRVTPCVCLQVKVEVTDRASDWSALHSYRMHLYVCRLRAGAWFRRMMECPLCHEVVFNGEWVSRRSDADNAASNGAAARTEPCPICAGAVPECLLVQPREKRTGVHRYSYCYQFLFPLPYSAYLSVARVLSSLPISSFGAPVFAVEEIRKLRAQMRERTASSLSRSATNSVMQDHQDTPDDD